MAYTPEDIGRIHLAASTLCRTGQNSATQPLTVAMLRVGEAIDDLAAALAVAAYDNPLGATDAEINAGYSRCHFRADKYDNGGAMLDAIVQHMMGELTASIKDAIADHDPAADRADVVIKRMKEGAL